jgi:hypothetical protein
MPTCNQNFSTQFFYYKAKQYSISDYIANREGFAGDPITCVHRHPLILANGKTRVPYFRHLNPEDAGGSPMTRWHAEWQSNFPKTEVPHRRKNSDQISNRKADIVLDDDRIVEIQHSLISKEEVDNRTNDYTTVHGKEVIWVIHANGALNISRFDQTGRVYLEFNSDHWKYESFLAYDYIYIDADSNIYKIAPKKVKSHMIDVERPVDKHAFIAALKTGRDLWTNTEPPQSSLFIKQQGAGNGKTYGIIQMLESEELAHYKTFIFVTKQHSAKTIIKNELETQVVKGLLTDISEIVIEENSKKYIIEYRNDRTQKVARIIIATIDALMFNIGNKNHSYYDKFQGIIDSIVDDHIDTDKAGVIKFAGVDPKLNKETLLVIDETQDLTVNYGKAVLNIMRNKYIDAYIVGDKLQSISNEHNAFTYLSDNEFPFIRVVKMEPTNICRRFTHPKLVQFCNEMIPFKKYGLPLIESYNDASLKNDDVADPIVFFEGKSITQSQENSDDKRGSEINKELENVMSHFTHEVEQNDRQPKDFLIITPFTSNNPLVDALQGRIDTYWKERKGVDKDDYFRYAIFHKSEEGSSIDLDESAESTRIVSIHSSKGDGRNVVFMLGFTESALKRFSTMSGTLIYDSLFHVAITRMKQKLYIQHQSNGDNFDRKITAFASKELTGTSIRPNLYVYNSIKYTDMIGETALNAFSELKEKFIDRADIQQLENNRTEKRIVDTGNHIMRYSSLIISILIGIVNKEQKQSEGLKQQVKAKLHAVKDTVITQSGNWKKYIESIDAKELAVVRIANKGRDYNRYYNIIHSTMETIRVKLKKEIDSEKIPDFCPFECVMLHHMIDIKNNGVYTDTTISDIYNLVDIYKNSYDQGTAGHTKCQCDTHFSAPKDSSVSSPNITNMHEYLHKHYEKVKYIDDVLRSFHTKYPLLNWLYNHVVKYNGTNKNFKIWRALQLVGYDKDTVVIAYIKPQFNMLNLNEVLATSIYDAYMLSNVEQYGEEDEHGNKKEFENYKRFNGKKIVSCVFTLDRKEPYYISWYDGTTNLIKANSDMLKATMYDHMVKHYSSENIGVQYFYKYWRTHCPTDKTAPMPFIEFLLDKYNEIKERNETTSKKLPAYIGEFLSDIKARIKLLRTPMDRTRLLEQYDNADFFLETIHTEMITAVKRYLNIAIEQEEE